MINQELSQGILKIEFNRPDKKNAFTDAMYRDLRDALIAGDINSEVKVILLCGAGSTFTSGNDLQDFLRTPMKEIDAPPLELLRALAQLKKPIVVAVNGFAVGIGATMLFHCDLVYAQKDAQFIFPFAALGLVPEGAISLLMPRLIGHQKASEILFFGEPMSADEARQIGLVNKVISTESVIHYAEQQALRLTKLSSGSLVGTKALLKDSAIQAEILNRIDVEGSLFIERLQGSAAKEAFLAFTEKRKPNFDGLN